MNSSDFGEQQSLNLYSTCKSPGASSSMAVSTESLQLAPKTVQYFILVHNSGKCNNEGINL